MCFKNHLAPTLALSFRSPPTSSVEAPKAITSWWSCSPKFDTWLLSQQQIRESSAATAVQNLRVSGEAVEGVPFMANCVFLHLAHCVLTMRMIIEGKNCAWNCK